MNFARIRELGKLYPKLAILFVATIFVSGGLLLNYYGVTFGLSRFFAYNPDDIASEEGAFPENVVVSEEVPVVEDTGAGSSDTGGSEPEAGGVALGSQTGDDPCADGDCDGDGYDNPVVGGNDCDDGNADVYPGNGCQGGGGGGGGGSDPAPTAEQAPESTEAPGVDPCADGDCDGDGYDNPVVGGDDCDDGDRTVYPGHGCVAAETTPTPARAQTPAPPDVDPCSDGDCDGDGYLNPVVGGNDCDDADPNLYPGHGCVGVAASPVVPPQTSAAPTAASSPGVDPCADGDCDGDGYLNPAVGGNDCDDGDAAKYPSHGCAGAATSPVVTPQATASPPVSVTPTVDPCADGDCDGDGYLNPVVGGNDCDDANPAVYPSRGCAVATAAPSVGPESTRTPSPTPTVDPCADGDCDGDGYLNPVIPGGNDCDDSNPSLYPGNGCPGVSTPTPTPIPGQPTPSATPPPTLGQVDNPCVDLDCDNDGFVRPSRVDVADGSDCNDLDAKVGSGNFDCDGDGAFNLQKPAITLAAADCNDYDASKKLECRPAEGGAPLIAYFQSDSVLVNTSETFKLSWDSKDATSCVGSDFDTGNKITGSVTAGPFSATKEITLTCVNAKGSTLKPLEILVNAPASHLECVSNACSVVAGSGSDSCASSGAACQSSANYAELASWAQSQGIQLAGTFTANTLQALKDVIGQTGSKGVLNKIDNNIAVAGAYASMKSNGTMGLPVGDTEVWAIFHEITHSILFGNGSLTSQARDVYKRSGNRSIVDFGPANANADEMAAYGAHNLFQGNNLADRARSLGLVFQYNFVAGLPGVNEPSISLLSRWISGLASILPGFQALPVKESTLGIILDTGTGGATGGDAVVVGGPAISILSPQNGQVISTQPALVSGEVARDGGSLAAIQKIRVEINRAFATDILPDGGSCVGGVSNCSTWSVSLKLKEGANEIRVIATDENGLESTPSVIMINVPSVVADIVSGATNVTLITPPVIALGSTPTPATTRLVQASGTPANTGFLGRVSNVKTGPGAATAAALVTAGLVSLLYVGYTGTNTYRRREAEDIAKDNRESGDMDFRS